MATFESSVLTEWVRDVENACGEFVGAEMSAMRLAGLVAQMVELGAISQAEASQYADDVYRMQRLAKLGHKYVKLARNPSPEMRDIVLRDAARERGR